MTVDNVFTITIPGYVPRTEQELDRMSNDQSDEVLQDRQARMDEFLGAIGPTLRGLNIPEDNVYPLEQIGIAAFWDITTEQRLALEDAVRALGLGTCLERIEIARSSSSETTMSLQ